MKKAVAFLFIVLYGGSVIGMGISKFYCCGKLRSSSFGFPVTKTENCGMSDKMDDCCKVKFTLLKIQDDHMGSSVIHDLSVSPAELPSSVFQLTQDFTLQEVHPVPIHGPPLIVPIYQFDCNYSI